MKGVKGEVGVKGPAGFARELSGFEVWPMPPLSAPGGESDGDSGAWGWGEETAAVAAVEIDMRVEGWSKTTRVEDEVEDYYSRLAAGPPTSSMRSGSSVGMYLLLSLQQYSVLLLLLSLGEDGTDVTAVELIEPVVDRVAK